MKKMIYFIPAIPFTLFFIYFSIGTSLDVTSVAWIIDILFILSGIFLWRNKWWGCIFGIVSGVILIYMGFQETGQIFKEYILGIPPIIFYIMCGYYVLKHKHQ